MLTKFDIYVFIFVLYEIVKQGYNISEVIGSVQNSQYGQIIIMGEGDITTVVAYNLEKYDNTSLLIGKQTTTQK